MPAERIAMRRIREVLRLKHECDLSFGQIAQALRIAKGTVSNYLVRAQAAGLDYRQSLELDDRALLARLHPDRCKRTGFAEPDFPRVHRELKRKGVTLQLLWEEYRQEASGIAYSRSRFCERYQLFVGSLRRSMRQIHIAGEKLFVDFAGPTMPILDALSGEISRGHIFVAVLGASNFTFAWATPTETQVHWIEGHIKAFEFMEAVPTMLVPDNPRALVHSADRYEPVINRTYQAMAEHYGCAVLPARPAHPKDKSKAELGVQWVQRWILARLRHRRFFSIAELNGAIAPLLAELNDKPFQKLQGTRRSWFEQIDRPAMRALPRLAFEYAEFKKARVSKLDYHVEFQGHYYSAPHSLVGQEVELRVTGNAIEILHQHRRIASHPRSTLRGAHTTLPEHMPASHRAHLQWSPHRLIEWAGTIGQATEQVVRQILQSKPHPEQGYRACLGMLALARRYGEQRLEAACARAVQIGAPRRKSVASILEAGLDRQPLPKSLFTEAALPAHPNVRGPKYYH